MMTAAEIIELVKKLPPEGQAEVLAFVKREMSAKAGVEEPAVNYAASAESGERRVRHIPQADAEQIADGILDRHSELFRKLAQ